MGVAILNCSSKALVSIFTVWILWENMMTRDMSSSKTTETAWIPVRSADTLETCQVAMESQLQNRLHELNKSGVGWQREGSNVSALLDMPSGQKVWAIVSVRCLPDHMDPRK